MWFSRSLIELYNLAGSSGQAQQHAQLLTCTLETGAMQNRSTARRSSGAPRRRRKNLYVDQPKIERVKALLGTSTETEAIDRALDLAEDWVVFGREVGDGLSLLVNRGGFTDRFPARRRR